MTYYAQLLQELRPMYCLRALDDLLAWDQETYMPEGASAARAEQVGTINKLAHDILCNPHIADLIEKAEGEISDHASEEWHALRQVKLDYERQHKVPAPLVAQISAATTKAQTAWAHARQEGDFTQMQDEFKQVVELSRQAAQCKGYKDHIYNAFLDDYEPGMTVAQLDSLFAELRPRLVSLVERLKEAGPVRHTLWERRYSLDTQRMFSHMISSAMGYDWKRGRSDEVIHAFCISASTRDVRITNNYKEYDPTSSVFTALHETGHALYEQGCPERWMHTPLEGGISMGWHESMSRLWENVIGRSLPFWEHFYPRYQEMFRRELESCSLNKFYLAINEVKPSYIRTEADEVTYNLHIMVRYELEKSLLDGTLAVEDVPEAWNETMKSYLGVVPPHDGVGCAQDVHWPSGLLGYFPSYALGNLRSAQVWERLKQDIPKVDDELRRGNLLLIRDWLYEHIYKWGKRLLPNELQMEAVGQELNAQPFINYLENKYGNMNRRG